MKVIDSICDRVAVLDNSTVAEIGDVRTVFANPKSDIAKKLIMPQGELPVTSEHGKKIRIIYNGENSSKSLLSDMILNAALPSIFFTQIQRTLTARHTVRFWYSCPMMIHRQKR